MSDVPPRVAELQDRLTVKVKRGVDHAIDAVDGSILVLLELLRLAPFYPFSPGFDSQIEEALVLDWVNY